MPRKGGHRMEARDAKASRSSEPRSRSPRLKSAPSRGGHRQLAREQAMPQTDQEPLRAPEADKQSAQEAYQRAVFELFLKNDMSAKSTQQLAQKAQGAGAKGAERIVAAGRWGPSCTESVTRYYASCCKEIEPARTVLCEHPHQRPPSKPEQHSYLVPFPARP